LLLLIFAAIIFSSFLLTSLGGAAAQEMGDYQFVTMWSGRYTYAEPFDAAVDQDGYVYVVHRDIHCVNKFSPLGEFVTSWGGKGNGDGQFNRPQGIAVDQDGYVYVVESSNNRGRGIINAITLEYLQTLRLLLTNNLSSP
jgi:DNA-binding beta-propeller fold protein YncE